VNSKGKISICFVGTNPKILESPQINEVANPVYLFSPKDFIPNLSLDDTKTMISRLGYFMGLNFSDKIIGSIHSLYGGHPFFTRQICSRIHQICGLNRPIDVSNLSLEKAKAQFAGQLDTYMRDIVESLYREYRGEFDILAAAVLGEKDDLKELVTEAPELVDHLIGYGLIETVGDDIDVRFEAVSNAVYRMLRIDTNEDRWAEISKRRNALENNIRRTLFMWCKFAGEDAFRNVFDGAFSNKRKSEINDFRPENIFSTKKSPLYLNDLIKILKDEQVLKNQLEGRRSTVVANLALINSLRVDAHAKEISPAEMNDLRKAFDILEIEFETP
jgi:hypothetical protein